MSKTPDQAIDPGRKRRSGAFLRGLKELAMFFEGRDKVHQSMRRVAKRLDKAKIPYAVVGGMAVFAHNHRRATDDVDILLTPEGFAEFRKQFVPGDYGTVPGRARRFVDLTNDITLDVLVTGSFPGSGQPGPIAYPNPDEVSEKVGKLRVVKLATLVQLKLAARRYQDFADVVALIRANGLDESFAELLHSSLRGDFIECLEEKRREDEYEARQG
jgi:hypothetical protein